MKLLSRLLARHGTAQGAAVPESTLLDAALPGPDGRAWLRVQLAVHSTPRDGGEDVEVRAHFSSDFSALQALPGRAARMLPSAAQHWVQKRWSAPALQRALAPLAGLAADSWLVLRTSNAPLAQGSRALLPEHLARIGITPGDAAVETWFGETPDGAAQVTLLCADDEDLPPPLRRLLRGRPFHMAAAVAHTVRRKPADAA